MVDGRGKRLGLLHTLIGSKEKRRNESLSSLALELHSFAHLTQHTSDDDCPKAGVFILQKGERPLAGFEPLPSASTPTTGVPPTKDEREQSKTDHLLLHDVHA